MADLNDNETFEMKGSGAKPYILKNTGGVYSCTCPAWRNQSVGIERRTCKHLRKLRGEEAEKERLGGAILPVTRKAAGEEKEGAPVLLAERYDPAIDVTGWWLSEKLDGVRAYWDGKQFLSRLGNPFFAPDWFIVGLPDIVLDGELFGGRKRFQRTVSIVRRQDKSDLWKEIQFLVFDAPDSTRTFEERQARCQTYLSQNKTAYAAWHEHQKCTGPAHVKQVLAEVEAKGGEGVMLRQPGSLYVAGRSSTLLKVKNFFDTEAKVIGHIPGEGRHKGRLGALLVEMPNGTRFEVGTGFSDAERESPPAFGSIISYRYQELSDGGVPRFPSYLGVRDDILFTGKEEDASPALAAKLVTTSPRIAALSTPPGMPYHLNSGEGHEAKPSGERSTPTATSTATTNSSVTASASAPLEANKACRLVQQEKFWEILVEGKQHTVKYGKIGSNGQSKTKLFPSQEAALQAAESLRREKRDKGYQEA